MNATGEIARVEPSENIASPTIVYFWGPVRDHVNRIAAEYVARLGSEPVWMNVDAGNSAAAPSPDVIPLAGENVFEFSPGPEPKFLAAGPDRLALEGPSKGTAQVVEGRPQVVFHFPPSGRSCCAKTPGSAPAVRSCSATLTVSMTRPVCSIRYRGPRSWRVIGKRA